jgi:hypothetical protein
VLACGVCALVVASPAATSVRWREVARGPTGDATAPDAPPLVVRTRADAQTIERFLPEAGRAALARVDLRRSLVVALFSDLGCKDRRLVVTAIERRGPVLRVTEVLKPLAPGEVECQALYGVYRVLALPKAQFAQPYPTRYRVIRA